MMNNQITNCGVAVSGSIACHTEADGRRVIRNLLAIRHSSFVICQGLLLMVIAQMCCSALAQAQTPIMTGAWNVEITFANERHHSLRFEAQDGGKGSLQ